LQNYNYVPGKHILTGQISFPNFLSMLEHCKNFHHKILEFLSEGQINYELSKNFIIMGNDN